ncbi:MAG: hypothetical protein ACRD1T_08750 [Acidimicrobiia bacterium]
MRRLRLLLVAVLALPMMAISTPPAHAYCAPDDGVNNPCECDPHGINDLWHKMTGKDLFACPM